MSFPLPPLTPAPSTWTAGEDGSAAVLRSDVLNAIELLTQPPVFQGSATGVPVPFTALASSNQITAPGTTYVAGAIVSFTGGSLPSPLVAGTLYTVQNPIADTFQLNSVTLTTNGSGTVQQVQEITSGAWQGVTLDTQVTDAWATHLTTSQPAYSFAMFPGVYLAEFTWPAAYSGGAGTLSAGITAQEGTGLPATYGGQRIPQSAVSGIGAQATTVKLLQFSAAGNYGAAGNNWAYGAVYQDTSTTISAVSTATRMPQLTLEWVRGLPGAVGSITETLLVPDGDAWPVPPAFVGRGFLNKNVRDTIGFLSARPAMEAYYAAGTYSLASQSSLPGTGATIPLDTAYIDPRGAFNAGTGIWTAPVGGVYDVFAQVPVTSASTTVAVAAGITVHSAYYNGGSTFTIWGAGQAAATSGASCAITRRRLRLNAGETVKLAGFQNDSSAAAATILAGAWSARLITIWRAK